MQTRSLSRVPRAAFRGLLVVLVACLCSVNLAAQVTSGTIFGTVKDPTGAMVPGVPGEVTHVVPCAPASRRTASSLGAQ